MLRSVKERLRNERRRRNLTQGDVAKSLGVSTNVVSSYESESKADIKLSTLERLLVLYGVHPTDFFRDITFPIPQKEVIDKGMVRNIVKDLIKEEMKHE